jgi:SAM-dependent methyltransferase
MINPVTSTDHAVRERYGEAARRPAQELCCAVEYDAKYLEAIPSEVLKRDYGCGDPTRHVRCGEVVLDLGSGSGKACFIAAQITGPAGRVIGIDMTSEMLELARRSAPVVARNLGYANVEFRSMTVLAFTGKQGPCPDRGQAVDECGPTCC